MNKFYRNPLFSVELQFHFCENACICKSSYNLRAELLRGYICDQNSGSACLKSSSGALAGCAGQAGEVARDSINDTQICLQLAL